MAVLRCLQGYHIPTQVERCWRSSKFRESPKYTLRIAKKLEKPSLSNWSEIYRDSAANSGQPPIVIETCDSHFSCAHCALRSCKRMLLERSKTNLTLKTEIKFPAYPRKNTWSDYKFSTFWLFPAWKAPNNNSTMQDICDPQWCLSQWKITFRGVQAYFIVVKCMAWL